MKKLINIFLILSFILTNLAPLTGLHIHKLASTVFLVLCVVHTLIYRKKCNKKQLAMLGIIFLAFASGILSMIFDHVLLIASLHTVISIGCVVFLAIHIFVFHRALRGKTHDD